MAMISPDLNQNIRPSVPVFTPRSATLKLADGLRFDGTRLGWDGNVQGELCFNTAMTGYQEILSDLSYAGQIIVFTFPHIGNVGFNDEDVEIFAAITEHHRAGAIGCILRADITNPSNYRSLGHLNTWLRQQRIAALCGVDTRALTRHIRLHGMMSASLCAPNEPANITARAIDGEDWSRDVTIKAPRDSREIAWQWRDQQSPAESTESTEPHHSTTTDPQNPLIVVVDFGVKRSIIRYLGAAKLRVVVVPATESADSILARSPDGVVLSNGPGDPAATALFAVPMIRRLLQESQLPILGICLGHQLLGLALGMRTIKMNQGHHGANHPVQDQNSRAVAIVSMNHGFTLDRQSFPDTCQESHISLFDGTNCGFRISGKPIFSVQFHPEASPGPLEGRSLFEDFAATVREYQTR